MAFLDRLLSHRVSAINNNRTEPGTAINTTKNSMKFGRWTLIFPNAPRSTAIVPTDTATKTTCETGARRPQTHAPMVAVTDPPMVAATLSIAKVLRTAQLSVRFSTTVVIWV